MAVTAAITAGVVALGSTAYQMKNASDQKNDAQKAADDAAKQQQDLQKQAQDQTAANNEGAIQKQARLRQQQASAASQGSLGTILTGPAGVSSSAPTTGGKTLLGM